jgi:hypothetical protein
MGVDWRSVDDSDLRELVIVRQDEKPGIQGCFYTFPDAQEFTTKDLFRPHPTLLDHWMFCGRVGNIVVFSTGEKLNPVTIEETVTGYEEVQGAVVMGTGRFQSGLIIEPVVYPSNEREFLASVDDSI